MPTTRVVWCAAAAAALGTARAEPARAQPPGRPAQPRLERLAEVVQRRLGLTELQAGRLRLVSARYAQERQALLAREHDARLVLREEVSRGPAADQARVRTALEALVDAQQRRAALLGGEQRELARFLSPVQRAQFLGLQERALRAAQRARAERGGRGGRGGGEFAPE